MSEDANFVRTGIVLVGVAVLAIIFLSSGFSTGLVTANQVRWGQSQNSINNNLSGFVKPVPTQLPQCVCPPVAGKIIKDCGASLLTCEDSSCTFEYEVTDSDGTKKVATGTASCVII